MNEFQLLMEPAGDSYTKRTQIELLAVMINNSKLSKEELLQAWDLAQVKEIQES